MSKRLRTGMIAGLLFVVASVAAAGPQFSLRDTAGVMHSQQEWSDKRAIVIFFTTVDCPLSNGYVPEMNRISKAYSNRGVAFYAVESDPTVPETQVRRHTADFQFAFPVLLDPKQFLVRLADASATPEVAVFSGAGKLLYLGRIDNRAEDIDRRRTVITEHDLTDALDSVLAGKPVAHPKTKVVGCIINYVANGKKI
jgi:hypothetical protein